MNGLYHDERHRYFYGDAGPMPGVTTIQRVIDKSGPLVAWAKRETAASALRNLDLLNDMTRREGGREAAQQWLSSIPDYQRDTAADIGTRIHSLASRYLLGESISPTAEEAPYLRAHLAFLESVQPVITMTEVMVCNLTLGYGGTFDLGCLIDGVPTLLDIKTGRYVYDETAIQLAGYAEAEFWATPDDPTKRPLPAWERYGVIHLQPSGARLVPFDVTDHERAAFRAALALYKWRADRAPQVMQPALTLAGAIA